MAIVRKYRSRVVRIVQAKPDIFVVTFESLEKPFKFKPGQFLHLALDEYDPTKAWPESRCFSMQSSPDDPLLKITFSVKGKYTTRLSKELISGKEALIKMAYGDIFQKEHDKSNCVFIAGGTGITPYLSLFTSRHFQDYKNPTLYFGIRDDSFNIYHEEISRSLTINPSLNVTIINQKNEGLLNIETILNDNGVESIYFISGPPVMIRAFKDYLISEQVNADQIRTDDWE
ncbi:FAD-dependent oxidoreductase [bacterium]|nr:FAD-dependent oxidoreductase [bacterium]